MNWQHLLRQVEDMMTDSPISFTEFKGILSTTDWYENEEWRNEQWWFGRGKAKCEVTFEQIRSIFDWMGLDKSVLMEAMRYQLERTVDELIANYADEEAQRDLMQEYSDVIEEEAA